MGKIDVSTCDGSTRFFKAQSPATQRLVSYTTFCGVGSSTTLALHLGRIVVWRPRNIGRTRKLNARSGMGVIARQILDRSVLDNVMSIFLPGLPEVAY